MKTYEVELRRTSFITIWVEAENEEEAEALAWHKLEESDDNTKYASWDIESVEEVTNQPQGESK